MAPIGQWKCWNRYYRAISVWKLHWFWCCAEIGLGINIDFHHHFTSQSYQWTQAGCWTVSKSAFQFQSIVCVSEQSHRKWLYTSFNSKVSHQWWQCFRLHFAKRLHAPHSFTRFNICVVRKWRKGEQMCDEQQIEYTTQNKKRKKAAAAAAAHTRRKFPSAQ